MKTGAVTTTRRLCECCHRRRYLHARRVLVGPGRGKLDVPENLLWECDECVELHETYPVSVFHLRDDTLAMLVDRLGELGAHRYLMAGYFTDILFHRRIYAWRLSPPRRRKRPVKSVLRQMIDRAA